MAAIETLIKVKKQAKTDDLITMLDEITIYEKLSKSKAFRDLRTSKAGQKKLPLLSGAYQGDLYSLSLLNIANNIFIYLTGQGIPVLGNLLEDLSIKDEKRMEILERSVIKVGYWDLTSYDHEVMKDSIVAIFAEEAEKKTILMIIVRDGNEYQIYFGQYEEEKELEECDHKPYVLKKDDQTLSITSYSILGNNAYPFGTFFDGTKNYEIMMPDYETIWLIPGEGEKEILHTTLSERNQIGLDKTNIDRFTETLLNIILTERGKHEKVGESAAGGIEED